MSASICYTLSGKRRFRRQRGANGDFGNLQICRVLSPSEVLIRGKVCVRVFIEVSVRACVSVCVVLCNSPKKIVSLYLRQTAYPSVAEKSSQPSVTADGSLRVEKVKKLINMVTLVSLLILLYTRGIIL